MRLVCPRCGNAFEALYRGRKKPRLVVKRDCWELTVSNGEVRCPYCGLLVLRI